MAGKVNQIINTIVEQRSKGNVMIADMTKAKLCMKGISPDKFNNSSDDDPVVIQKLMEIAKELNVNI